MSLALVPSHFGYWTTAAATAFVVNPRPNVNMAAVLLYVTAVLVCLYETTAQATATATTQVPVPVVAQTMGVSDADVYNFALNLEYLEANFYHCGAYGTPIANNGGGPDPEGCVMGQYSDAVHNLFVELARDEQSHVTGIQSYLGASAVAQPQINLTAVSAAANAAYGTTLSPMFNYYSSDVTGLLSAFIFEDVGVTAYNGAAPLISDKTLLAAAVGIGLIEGYHAGIIRKTLFDQMSDPTGYGNSIGEAVSAVSALRGKVSAMASNTDPPNSADEGFQTDGEQTIVPSGPYNIAFSRTPQEVLAIVYLGSATTPGGFFPAGLNGSVK